MSGSCQLPSSPKPLLIPLAGSLIHSQNLIPLSLPTAARASWWGEDDRRLAERLGLKHCPPGAAPSLHHLCFGLSFLKELPHPLLPEAQASPTG